MTISKNIMTNMAVVLALTGMSACTANVSSTEKAADEVDAPVDGKLDGVSIVEHDGFHFGDPTPDGEYHSGDEAELSSNARSHSWMFTLSADAEISVETRGHSARANEVDTVMYLYKRTESGSWGRYLRRNDDANADTVFSVVDDSLGAGTYRIVVKGYDRSSVGRFDIAATCTGEGCEQAEAPQLCGENLDFLLAGDVLIANDNYSIRANSQVSEMLGDQIVRAVRQSVRTSRPIRTWQEALALADANSMSVTPLVEAATGRDLVEITFYISRSIKGALFYADSSDLFAQIVFTNGDGRLDCGQ